MQGASGKPFIQGPFFVASYQRGYRWGRDEVRQLLDDIKANAAAAEKRGTLPSDYYLQPIVVLKRDDGWELVDGQQRLTTLYLIAKYVATKFADTRLSYSLDYETRPGSRDYLETLDPLRRDENIDFHHIAAAYDVIVEWFSEQSSPGQAAIDLHTALSKWVYVIWYEAPPQTDANELFIRLNRDRIPLTDSELIKALVLSDGGAAEGESDRQHEIAAQWDGFERDLRNDQFWAFLTGSAVTRPTHIDFLFESMTPAAGLRVRPRYWTFTKVLEQVEHEGAAAFWRNVVERFGLLVGWYSDLELYHRVGYLAATGTSIGRLVDASRSQTHSAFRRWVSEEIKRQLGTTRSGLSLFRYDHPKQAAKCAQVLLLMNVETVLRRQDPSSRFSFHAFSQQGWSLEHIHAQNSEELKTEPQRRDWIQAHLSKIERTQWAPESEEAVERVIGNMREHLAMPVTRTDDKRFAAIAEDVFELFSVENGDDLDSIHGLQNLALLQRDFNSKLNNAVFALKRERILELDKSGAHILPCTRNVFMKYYTGADEQQLSFWSPQDRSAYYDAIVDAVSDFLLPDEADSKELAA